MDSTWSALREAVEGHDDVAVSKILCSELRLEENDLLSMMQDLAMFEQHGGEESASSRSHKRSASASCKFSREDTQSPKPTGAASSFDTDGETDADPDHSLKASSRESSRFSSTCVGDSPKSRSIERSSFTSFSTSAHYGERDELIDDTLISFEHQDIKTLRGYFSHPSYGNVRVLIDVELYDASSGSWTRNDESKDIRVQLEGDSVLMTETGGAIQLDGKIDSKSGFYTGCVIQDGVHGGYFELHPCFEAQLFRHTGPQLSDLIGGTNARGSTPVEDVSHPLRPRVSFSKASSWRTDFSPSHRPVVRLCDAQDVTVVSVGPEKTERIMTHLPKQGLKTFGDLRLALAEQYGQEQVANVKFVIRNDGAQVTHMDTDVLRTARVFAIGFPVAFT